MPIKSALPSLAILLIFTPFLPGEVGPLGCATNVSVTPTLRAEGYAQPIGDITLICTGGTAVALGATLPLVNIQVSLNTAITNRLYANSFSNAWSEALLIVDEPGSGLAGVSATQRACNDTTGLCLITGTGDGQGTYDGSAARPNIFQGIVSGNSVTFYNIPVDPPQVTGRARVFRITNIRANATCAFRRVRHRSHSRYCVHLYLRRHFAAYIEPHAYRRVRAIRIGIHPADAGQLWR